MDKKQGRNITIGIIVLVVLLLIVIFVPTLSRISYEYSYLGADGIEYNISVDKHTGKPIHIVSFWIDYRTVNNVPQFRKEYKVPFEYGPEELEGIPLDDTINDLIFNKSKTKNIYITRDVDLDIESDGKMAIAILTAQRILSTGVEPAVFKINTISALTEENEFTQDIDIPVRTCDDSGNGRTIILFEKGDENQIYLTDNDCIILEFIDYDDAIAVSTKLVYHLVGIF
ncbi:MAG: hypothetical protein ABIH25_01835 [Candidatus Woesearchaeota archaeon]